MCFISISIFFFKLASSPTCGSVVNLVAICLDNWDNFIRFLYNDFRKENESWVKSKLSIASGFFLLVEK